MTKKTVELNHAFRIQTFKAIIAIIVFIISYIILLGLAFVLIGLCLVAGFYIIALRPMFLTFALGIGLAAMSILVVLFLLKFFLKSHKVDRSHLIEINEQQQPDLFKLIHEIVEQVGTNFPKKVYLSADVNASVFYDSSFWSMFLPIKKNLLIGLGLVNSVTKDELKAILAHEFGHFSQRTMKVGSYVYYVNQVIFNIINDNESYDDLQQRIANINDYLFLFAKIAAHITRGIKWILIKLYGIVNISYMGLSREMEFHADEIAASITGYEPLKKSLLRLTMADNAYNNVLNYYNGKIADNIKSESLYNDQTAVMKFLADVNKLPIYNHLPDITLEEQSKFDKSKLVIKNQWASHPSNKDRIERLEKTGYHSNKTSDSLANELFKNLESYQQQLTHKVFETVSYEGEVTTISSEIFISEYKQETLANSFSEIYNGYYDNHNPVTVDVMSQNIKSLSSFSLLYTDEKVDMIYSVNALKADIDTLKNIAQNLYPAKTFDYDGVKYKRKDAEELWMKLEIDLNQSVKKVVNNDQEAFEYFMTLAKKQDKTSTLKQMYTDFIAFDKLYEKKFELYISLLNSLSFVSVTTTFELIRTNISKVKELEVELKEELKVLLSDPILNTEITQEMRNQLEKYRAKDLIYFVEPVYNDENLNTLYTAIHNYSYLILRKYFLLKQTLLNFQTTLL